ncbi:MULTISPECIES: alpha/beta fold hydrolase [unclassified Paenibacillus]|uniref:alpha/beta fold hydrolase n=1 Tax=unclassified Paenibacillus TaxID=185978 RepID=UPI0036774FF6
MKQGEIMKMKMGPKMKKALNIFLKTVGVIAVAIVLFLVVTSTVNVISTKSETAKIQSYGQLVPVDGKKMNVMIQGDGEETVVLLPGYGTASPALDFKLLIDELSSHYRVVAVEPFGYGLSDGTKKERTTENIISEVHEALQQLNIDRYVLGGHSIAGIYGIAYVNKYPNEVTGFVGVDTSVPTQAGMDAKLPIKGFAFLEKAGLVRLIKKVGSDPYTGLAYDEQTKEQMRLISNKNSNNSTNLDEMQHIASNFEGAKGLTFPKELPLIFFIDANNTANQGWQQLHEDQIKDSVHGKVVPLPGSHYLHHTKYKEIAEGFKEFMEQAK